MSVASTATTSAVFRHCGANGTAGTATPCATGGGVTAGYCRTLHRDCAVRPTYTTVPTRDAAPPRPSTSSRCTTDSPSPISSPTTASTTKPTPKVTATAPTTTAPGTAGPRGQRTTPTCLRCGRIRSGLSLSPCYFRQGCRCCWAGTSSAALSRETTTPTARTTTSPGSTGPRSTLTFCSSRRISSRCGVVTRYSAGAATPPANQRRTCAGSHRPVP